MKQLPLIILIFLLCLNSYGVFAQQSIFIDILEEESHIEVKSFTENDSIFFRIDNKKKLFSSCYIIDKIVSKVYEGNVELIQKLNKEINYLSELLITPIESQIDDNELINIKISKASIRIPFEFLRFHFKFIYKQKPIIFSYEPIKKEQLKKLDFKRAYIICDTTADPEEACADIHKIINSEFHYMTEVNIDSIRNALNFDLLLMSIHGEINIESCDGFIYVNDEKMFPSVFSQKDLKLIYFDSCHLGKGKNFIDRFQSLNAEYFIAPIISNEAGNSSTKTMLTFFKHLEENHPSESLMKTKKELIPFAKNNMLVELWFAASFRLYKLN